MRWDTQIQSDTISSFFQIFMNCNNINAMYHCMWTITGNKDESKPFISQCKNKRTNLRKKKPRKTIPRPPGMWFSITYPVIVSVRHEDTGREYLQLLGGFTKGPGITEWDCETVLVFSSWSSGRVESGTDTGRTLFEPLDELLLPFGLFPPCCTYCTYRSDFKNKGYVLFRI